MICTEEEAKTKWCPFGRVALTVTTITDFTTDKEYPHVVATANRSEKGALTASTCLGSLCMAWRGREVRKYSVVRNDVTETYNWDPRTKDDYSSQTDGVVSDLPVERYGFCGLAGSAQT